MRFVTEETLGKLAKWLRMLGFDTIYERGNYRTDDQDRGRIRLSRTCKARERWDPDTVLVMVSDNYLSQLRQVIQELGIRQGDIRPFSRCIRCNCPICIMDKNKAIGKVPDYVWETQELFHECPSCGRIYWPGTHTRQSLEKIQTMFD